MKVRDEGLPPNGFKDLKMASCNKCGRPKLRTRTDGLKWCRRCGAMVGMRHVDRSGNPPIGAVQPAIEVRP